MNVSVFGGGAWGRALAFALAEKNDVKIVSRRDISSLLAPLNERLLRQDSKPIVQVSHNEALNSQYFVMAIATSALNGVAYERKAPKGDKNFMCK